MTRENVTCKPETNLLECCKKMVKKRVRCLPLTRKKQLTGFITQKDILWAIVKKSKENLKEIKAIDVSPKKIITIRPTATVDEAFKKMKKLKLERLPVIKEKELVGIVSLTDILNFNPEFYPELEELSRIREESKKLKRINESKNSRVEEGTCEECGNYGDLYNSKGMLVCSSCKA